MPEASSGPEHLLDEYMEALDRYGLARAELEAVETSKTEADPKAAEDRVQMARWEFCQARHRYRRRNVSPVSLPQTV